MDAESDTHAWWAAAAVVLVTGLATAVADAGRTHAARARGPEEGVGAKQDPRQQERREVESDEGSEWDVVDGEDAAPRQPGDPQVERHEPAHNTEDH